MGKTIAGFLAGFGFIVFFILYGLGSEAKAWWILGLMVAATVALGVLAVITTISRPHQGGSNDSIP